MVAYKSASVGGQTNLPTIVVRYAQERGLNLDFTTPSKRPDPKSPPLFVE